MEASAFSSPPPGLTPSMSMWEHTQGETDAHTWAAWAQEHFSNDLDSAQLSATTAAYHADIATQNAAQLAQYMQYLWLTVMRLQGKVSELEDWKKKALEDVRKLRDEQRALRRCVLGEDATSVVSFHGSEECSSLPGRSKTSMSLSTAGSSSCLSAAPPGLPSPQGLPPPSLSMSSDIDVGPTEGLTLTSSDVDGVSFTCVEWRIAQLSLKLRGCMGRALVSPPFAAVGLEDLRLMVCADGKDAAKGARNKRQKELYTKKVSEGPLDACLKLKVPNCPANLDLEYFLKVGSSRRGPFRHNFSENTVNGCDDFGVDWLKQLEGDHSLIVSVEIKA